MATIFTTEPFLSYKSLVDKQAAEESYIQWFDILSEQGKNKHMIAYALWCACSDGNHRLVTHIVNHSAKSLVNQRLHAIPMLSYAITVTKPWLNARGRDSDYEKSKKSWEQVRACAQILIDVGADVNVCCHQESI